MAGNGLKSEDDEDILGRRVRGWTVNWQRGNKRGEWVRLWEGVDEEKMEQSLAEGAIKAVSANTDAQQSTNRQSESVALSPVS